MRISAAIRNLEHQLHTISTDEGRPKALNHSPISLGFGSGVNMAELLCLALDTWYCNDLYCVATKRNIRLANGRVDVESDFGAYGKPARKLNYNAKVITHASD